MQQLLYIAILSSSISASVDFLLANSHLGDSGIILLYMMRRDSVIFLFTNYKSHNKYNI